MPRTVWVLLPTGSLPSQCRPLARMISLLRMMQPRLNMPGNGSTATTLSFGAAHGSSEN
jgi:hypothetical protein